MFTINVLPAGHYSGHHSNVSFFLTLGIKDYFKKLLNSFSSFLSQIT